MTTMKTAAVFNGTVYGIGDDAEAARKDAQQWANPETDFAYLPINAAGVASVENGNVNYVEEWAMTTTPALDPKTRSYRFGYTSAIYWGGNDQQRRFAEYDPSEGPMGAAGVIREFNRVSRQMGTTFWTCSVWQGDELIAGGPGLPTVRDLIRDYEYSREEAAYLRRQMGGRRVS